MALKAPRALRRIVVRRVDDAVLRRYRTLAARRVRSNALDEATLRAAARIAERAVQDERSSDGADKSLTQAFRALAEGDLSGARPSPAVRRAVIEQFHRLYYHSGKQTWKNTRFYGVTVWKNPMDLWLYQEMIHEFRPDVVIEAGTKYGGSAYYFARLFDLVGHGQVITIDTKPQPNRPEHPRITYLTGSSTDPAIAESVDELVGDRKPLIVLDSYHARDHVLEELRLWSPRVPLGRHIVVEDSHAGGNPVTTRVARGPRPAIKRFLSENDAFVVDESMHKFFFTFNPGGYLKRVR
jgi:cephalosporin hydroxylase